METDIAKSLYAGLFGREPLKIQTLAGAGSNRRYFRLSGAEGTVIATAGDDVVENRAFLYLSRIFEKENLNVPRILAVSADEHVYLQSDLGSVQLFSLIETDSPQKEEYIRKAMRLLADVQFRGGRNVDFSRCFPVSAMDARSVMWDLNYFKYSFLKLVLPDFSESALEDDFCKLCDMLLDGHEKWETFMVRDFQSRNVMVHNGETFLIDYQGGRRGPVEYDVASFLWQARAGFSDAEREEYVEAYLSAASRYRTFHREDFMRRLKLFALFRTMQVLGAYGFRGLFEQKAHFVRSIPAAIANLRALLPSLPDSLGALRRILEQVCDAASVLSPVSHDGLTVRVMSFSYMKGIPRDFSGNGGGFVFDCRAVHNPGRYDEYKSLTGRDKPVRDFLEKDGEILEFLRNVYGLVDASVTRYLKRGFSNLMVCFGCTGGQHRSVYSAEALASHLSERYGVRVELVHREQGITEIFEAK